MYIVNNINSIIRKLNFLVFILKNKINKDIIRIGIGIIEFLYVLIWRILTKCIKHVLIIKVTKIGFIYFNYNN